MIKSIFKEIKISIIATIVFVVIFCGLYPLAVWAIGQVFFNHQANGSLITNAQGQVIGSSLIGQQFTGDQYFEPRPSAAGQGYDPTASGGTNLGPTSQKLADMIKANIAAYRLENNLSPNTPVPADAVEASASGLDPDISIQNAMIQIPRVAKARSLSVATVKNLINENTDYKFLGFIGENGVNVVKLNIALDALSSSNAK